MLYEVNNGIRDYFTYTDAMLNNSLFSFYLRKKGLNIYIGKKENSKNESTRDLICLDFDFGSRSFDEEIERLEGLLEDNISEDSKKRIEDTIKTVKKNKDLYSPKRRDEIRNDFYEKGVDINYIQKKKDGHT